LPRSRPTRAGRELAGRPSNFQIAKRPARPGVDALSGSFEIRYVGPAEPSYLSLLSRLRWHRAFRGRAVASLLPPGVLEVRDPISLPAPGAAEALSRAARARPGAAIIPVESDGAGALRWEAPPASTLRELEASAQAPRPGCVDFSEVPDGSAAVFRPEGGGRQTVAAEDFRVLRVRRVYPCRPEIVAAIPESGRSLLDVGCGSGETASDWKRRGLGRRAAGIELDRNLAASARERLDEVREGDAVAVLRELAGTAGGSRFDAVLFADSLEHLEDPDEALAAAARLLPAGGALVASVPNAAGAPLVGDLIRGRFDPIGAGIEDCGHLRWYTRESLRVSLESAGFRVETVEGVPVPGGPEPLARLLGEAGIARSAEDLAAIQWIAVARRR